MDKSAIFKRAFVIIVISLNLLALIKMAVFNCGGKSQQPKRYQDSLAAASLRIINTADRLNAKTLIQIKELQDSVISLNSQIAEIDGESIQIENSNNERIIYINRLSTDSLAMLIANRYKNK